MQKKAHIVFWFVACALALPLVLYALSPTVLSWLVEKELKKRGAERIRVELGYPGWRSTSFNVLSLEKHLLGSLWVLRINKAEIEYRIPQVLSGTLNRIHLPNVSLQILPQSRDNGQPPADHSNGLLEVLASSAIGVGAITKPFPTLPFEEFSVDSISISHPQAPSPFQQLLASGVLRYRGGALAGKFTFKGQHAPPYELTLAAKRIGDMSLVLQSPIASPHPVVSVTSELSQSESEIHVAGKSQIDIKELVAFLALFYPIRDLDKATGTLTIDWRGSSPEHVSIGSLVNEKSASLEGTFRLALNSPSLASYLEDLSLLMNGAFSARAGQMDWSLARESNVSVSIDTKDLSLPDKIRGLFPGRLQDVSINLPRTARGQVSFPNNRPHVSVDGTIQARYGTTRTPLELMLSISNPSGELQHPSSSKADFNLSGSWRGKPAQSLPLREAKWDVTGLLSLESDHIQLVVAPPSLLQAAVVQVGATTVPKASVKLTKKMAVVYKPKTGTWQADPTLLRIRAPVVQWDQKTFSIAGTTLRLERLRGGPSTWNAQGELFLAGLLTHVRNLSPPATNWKLDFSATPAGILIDLSGRSTEGAVSARGRVEQNFSTQEGALDLRVFPVTFSSPSLVLSKLIQPWRYPFDIASGQVSALGSVSWKLNTSPSASAVAVQHADATVVLEHISGHYKKIMFNDFSTTLRVEGSESWGMPKPAKVTLGELKSGLDLKRIAMNVQIVPKPLSSSYMVTIRDFSCQLLGGQALSDNIALQVPFTRSALSVALKQLDLGEIFKLEQQEGLQGTGLLDGTLPITISTSGLEIHQGRLEALPPGGWIRFHPAQETAQSLWQSSPNMRLILDALSNFHYRVLEIGADYQPDGQLTLQVRLEGKNPDLKKGQPIHFNLKIEENILSLIKTLQVVRGIEEQIKHLYQR